MDQASRTDRQEWMRVLALAEWDDLKVVAADLPVTEHTIKRAPETGLVMLRGRIGGSGAAFNLGETTVTRCSVKLTEAIEGHAYVMGRNSEHARVAAICDGLLQLKQHREAIDRNVIQPLRQKLDAKKLMAAQKAAATKVDFFTLVRGDG
jgi:alpha-D-ribose 1-methylphosphonate 5-triphosphate synthase subunit PhnG